MRSLERLINLFSIRKPRNEELNSISEWAKLSGLKLEKNVGKKGERVCFIFLRFAREICEDFLDFAQPSISCNFHLDFLLRLKLNLKISCVVVAITQRKLRKVKSRKKNYRLKCIGNQTISLIKESSIQDRINSFLI